MLSIQSPFRTPLADNVPFVCNKELISCIGSCVEMGIAFSEASCSHYPEHVLETKD